MIGRRTIFTTPSTLWEIDQDGVIWMDLTPVGKVLEEWPAGVTATARAWSSPREMLEAFSAPMGSPALTNGPTGKDWPGAR